RRSLLDPLLQDRQRHGPILEDLVELLEVEPGSERRLRFGPSAGPGHVADLVAAGLAHLRAVAFDLALDARPGKAGRRDHIVDRLFAAPALGGKAGVDDETSGPEQEALQITGALDAIVGAKLVRQLLGIKRPAFRIGREAAYLAKRRYVLGFLGQADLQMMAGHAFVERKGGQRIFRPVADVLQIDEVDGRA